jgi:oligoendopeptidase F
MPGDLAGGIMRNRISAGAKASVLLVIIASIASLGAASSEDNAEGNATMKEKGNATTGLEIDNVTTTWNLSILFPDGETAALELQRLRNESQHINSTYRGQFGNLTGKVLLDYIEDSKNFSRSLDVLYTYAYAQNSLNVNDAFFETLFSDAQNLFTEYTKAVSFADVKLKSLSNEEWEKLLAEEQPLEKYRQFFENNYIRYSLHRPRNESHAAYLADLSNQLLKLETEGMKRITNNVTNAGNITLVDGKEFSINSQTYPELMSTDPERENRKRCYEKRFYHTINQSGTMAEIYMEKSRLDDLYSKELNFSDAYDAKMFNYYLNASQIEDMNSVLKERKGVFDGYYEFRKRRMSQDLLRPYDLALQLTKDPGVKYGYNESLEEIYS